ncbi:hypothetical protein [uncultured Oscillibacter sp.]|uniref:hypothetical protein n=1 Tax=uncultured Oscillibacter sp. TaxID=876091 RepID=UPI0025F26B1D|nr:hypothetical protein [uncultured Oscillibacter sp.]
MVNRSCGRNRQVRAVPARPADPAPPAAEPPVRRWPHPVDGTDPLQAADPALHYIHCALSYQNQLLADIKALLEQMTVPAEEEK